MPISSHARRRSCHSAVRVFKTENGGKIKSSLRRLSCFSGFSSPSLSSPKSTGTPHASLSIPKSSFALAMASSSQSRLAAAVALSANASSRPSFVSKSISFRFTATSSFPVVSIIITSSMPALAKPSVVLFPAIILLFLSSRIERPAPNVRRLFSIMLCPNCVPLLKFKSSGIRSSIFVFLIFAISNRF